MCVRFNNGETPNISLINESNQNLDLYKIAKALNYQIKMHLQPAWGVKAQVITKNTDKSWKLLIKENLPIIGVEGYHSINKSNIPFSEVKINQDINQTTLTISHEVIEMIINPNLTMMYKNELDFYLGEICDPSCKNYYFIQDIAVSNFVYPSWFDPKTTISKFDHMNIIKKPLEISKGGYASIFTNNKWKSIFS